MCAVFTNTGGRGEVETCVSPSFLVSPPPPPLELSSAMIAKVNKDPTTPPAALAIFLRHAASAKNVFFTPLADDSERSKSEVTAASTAKINPFGAISRARDARAAAVWAFRLAAGLASAATVLNSSSPDDTLVYS